MTEGFAFDGIDAELTPDRGWRQIGTVYQIEVEGLTVGAVASLSFAKETAHTIRQNGFRAIVVGRVHLVIQMKKDGRSAHHCDTPAAIAVLNTRSGRVEDSAPGEDGAGTELLCGWARIG